VRGGQAALAFRRRRLTLYIDRKSKLISRMSYSDGGTRDREFTDYATPAGSSGVQAQAPTAAADRPLDLKAVELEPKLEPALFDKPGK